MIFLDTCVWIELLGVRTPVKQHEIIQAKAATYLLEKMIPDKKNIITCKEQILELVSSIEKVTMRTVNKTRKQNKKPGISNLKEFRMLQEFQATKELCKEVIDDIQYFATVSDIGEYDIPSILQRLELADINDCLYYDYCVRKNIGLYTFDSDLMKLGNSKVLHRFNTETGTWN